MRPITTIEVQNLRLAQECTFFDKCMIGVYSETTDSFGDVIKTWVYGLPVSCGVELLNGYERVNGSLVFTGILARVRLPIDTVLTTKDKIKLGTDEYGIRSLSGKYCMIVDCEGVKA